MHQNKNILMALQLSIYFNSFALQLTLGLSTRQFAPAFTALFAIALGKHSKIGFVRVQRGERYLQRILTAQIMITGLKLM